MNQIPDVLYADRESTTWLILGASRGIGLEFVRQLLQRGERIIATVREPFASHASALWGQAGSDHGRCQMYICDVLSEDSIIVRLPCLPTPLSRPLSFLVPPLHTIRHTPRSPHY